MFAKRKVPNEKREKRKQMIRDNFPLKTKKR